MEEENIKIYQTVQNVQISQTAKYIFNESNKEFMKIKTCEHNNYYRKTFPTLKLINNIEVECYIVLRKIPDAKKNYYFIKFVVECPRIKIDDSYEYYELYSYGEKLKKYSAKKIDDFILNIKNNIICNLKLDKLFGKFILSKKDDNIVVINENNIGIDIFGLEYSNFNDCVVCYEKTNTLTSCNHNLCVSCWNKLNKKNSCPFCRGFLLLKNDDYSDKENEDDDDDEENEDSAYESIYVENQNNQNELQNELNNAFILELNSEYDENSLNSVNTDTNSNT